MSIKKIVGLIILFGLAGARPVLAQETTLYSTAESGGGSSPPQWLIGCSFAVSGSGADVSVDVTLTWDAPGSSGSQSHTDTAYGYLSGVITRYVDATVDDMTVICDATFTFSGSFNQVIVRQASAVIPGLRPIDLHVDPTIPDQWTYTAPGDYLLWRSWQVYDRTGPWLFDGRPVNESYTIHQNGCNLVVHTASTTTQQGGRFGDKYGNYDGNSRIPACSQNPNCSTTSTQTLTVNGVDFSHSVDWGCYGVIIGRS